jgi:hypothetical protein
MRVRHLAILLLAASPAAADQDRQDYYYPAPQSSEVFDRTLAPAPEADRGVRIAFVTQVTQQQLAAPSAPRYAVFAKGEEADELIITALDDQVFATLFRARAVMAQLSAPARTTEFFVKNRLSATATFYDMLKVLGFDGLTLTDGRTWSHRVEFR